MIIIKQIMRLIIISTLLSFSNAFCQPAITQPIPLKELKNYLEYPAPVQKLIQAAYDLSTQDLTYTYASSDPKNGGMDCSGTIYYLLHKMQIDAPRQSDEMYEWVKAKGDLHLYTNNQDAFRYLQPGDLLFWGGTYDIQRSVTHVMLYLGPNKNNKPLMFGASNGRTYQGKKMWGVSVFDFKLPEAESKAKFLGYSCIPGFSCRDNGKKGQG